MKKLITILAVLAIAVPVLAQQTLSYGWENGVDTVLGYYGTPVNEGETPIFATINDTQVNGGMYSLQLIDNAPSGTPQAFVAAVYGLQEGDEVTGVIYRYDDTESGAPSCRIWGHWNNSLGTPEEDITGYDGSASGNNSYGDDIGWGAIEYTWVVPAEKTGLIIEVRTYSNAGDTVWVDDLTVTAPDGATIRFADGGTVGVQNQSLSAVKALFN